MKKITENIIYQSIYRILLIITPLVTSPYLSRVLGAEGLGLFSASQAYINYFIILSMLGIESYGTRKIASVQHDKKACSRLFEEIYVVQLFAGGISLSFYLITLSLFFSGERLLLQYVQMVWLFSALLDINWFFYAKELFKITVLRNIFIKLLTVLSIFLFVKGRDDLDIYALILAGSALVSQIVLWGWIRKYVGFSKIQFKNVIRHIPPIFQLFVPTLAGSFFCIFDKTAIDLFSTKEQLGFYYNADKIINIPLGILSGINMVMLPRISNLVSIRGKAYIQAFLDKSLELSISIISAIAFGIGAIAPVFVPIFFGEGFEECTILINLFVPVLIIKAFSSFIRYQYLIPCSLDKTYIFSTIAGALTLVVCLPFIYFYDARGAVAAVLVADFCMLCVQIFFTRKYVNFIKIFSKKLIYLMFGVLMYAGVWFYSTFVEVDRYVNLLTSVLVGAFIYLLCSGIYIFFNRESVFVKGLQP